MLLVALKKKSLHNTIHYILFLDDITANATAAFAVVGKHIFNKKTPKYAFWLLTFCEKKWTRRNDLSSSQTSKPTCVKTIFPSEMLTYIKNEATKKNSRNSDVQ